MPWRPGSTCNAQGRISPTVRDELGKDEQ
ncbi:uncharacterized protein ARMOST_15018 [Armillaria ostoyae]|uniref:Uncharacterized protein n=1 Tax=Armillaria ostoyae TaxID=47428 RepID=A0A284RS68_ARMOS|nr:uncharacterized protein ARMOST_15018 [Armillaria ostoyae]